LDATLILADAAQVSPDGKLHAIGIGWQHTTSPTTAPAAVAVILHVPWDETNRKIKWTLDLLSADGKPVVLQTGPETYAPIHMENEIEVGRPPGIKQGSSINVPFSVTVGPMPLPADSAFEWALKIGNRKWSVSFATRPLQQPPTR
jgi:hypothetical protein